ncbi:uncharacterized protein [Palaemon carinicauda]|uniref:uncharacterized protein n=1 Tax=Palaemon carinicauda TaxID=392227 RepID=UPI0035B5C508
MDDMRRYFRMRKARADDDDTPDSDDDMDDDFEEMLLRHHDDEYMRHLFRRYGRRGPWGYREEEESSPVGSDGFRFKFVKPKKWTPPEKVEAVLTPPQTNHIFKRGIIFKKRFTDSDAKLYTMKEKEPDGSSVSRTILKMPSYYPGEHRVSEKDIFNIVMADVSGSMSSSWKSIKDYWNCNVAPNLVGKTRIFTFSTSVKFRRDEPYFAAGDFSGGSTELSGALQTILSQIYTCTQKFVNIFIITDGDHNCSSVTPASVIELMEAQSSKICNVFLLGVGDDFPVQYSIDIRSRLHNGSSNLPSIYWAKLTEDIKEQMEEIGNKLPKTAFLPINLNTPGYQMPGLKPKHAFHIGEFVYFPDELTNEEFEMKSGEETFTIKVEPKQIDVETLLDVFRQWNTCIIQLKYKKERIPENVIPLMENFYETLTKRPKSTPGKSIRERMQAHGKATDMEFRTLINKIKEILTREKFENQIELAENILRTSVTRSKYEVKALQLKGHTDKEFEDDCEEFLKIYEANKENILKLPIQHDHLCRTTLQSTLTDLQDEDFPELLKKEKFEFLKSFTISGIPIYAPTRDSVTLNPWSYRIQRILKNPYTTMSQVAMENMAQPSADKVNKEVQAKKDDDSTNFNAIVPVFPPNIAKTMTPIIRTKIYAMCVTFATLKNPHIIDFNIHMATLAVTWVRFLFENPTIPRSEYVKTQMESIEATAQCYMDRPSYANYVEMLKSQPELALMTESTVRLHDKTIKCETIIKPMFILNLMQLSDHKLDMTLVTKIMKLILVEYTGRCLSHYKSEGNEETPYTDFFTRSREDQETKKQFIQDYAKNAKAEILSSGRDILIESFYTFEDVRKPALKVAKQHLESMKEKMTANLTIEVNVEKVKLLRNVTSAGDVSWETLETYARHIGLQDEVVSQLFSYESMFVYTAHALRYRSSRDRLAIKVEDFDTYKNFVTDEVRKENLNIVSKQLLSSLTSVIEDEWLKEYLDIHTEVVEPMTPQQIVYHAQQLGVDVTEETFHKVYKRYRPKLGLLGNACQTKKCPYYLLPNENYNQHASVERLKGRTPFIHGLHQTIHKFHNHDFPTILKEISSGEHTRKKEPFASECVVQWESGIKKLVSIYSEQEKSSTSS